MRWRAGILALLILAATAATAAADTTWLCRPDRAGDPCTGDQTTTRVAVDGTSRVDPVTAPADPPVDCFYVYPTVSNQVATNAAPTADPEVRSIALQQAQRFSTRCRVYAPLYRQVTVTGVLAAGQTRDTAPYATAYDGVEQAFRDYLRDDNRGRGFVLVGHSQGSRMLRALLRRVIEPDPQLRDRLVAAVIPGANATTNDTPAVPACAAPGDHGCVVSYSTFDETPPANSRFGRTDTDPVGDALDLPDGPVLCTDPTILSGTPGQLHSLTQTTPFAPGVIKVLLLRLYGGPEPTAPTPWLEPQDHYTAQCQQSNGANVLMVAPVGNARKLTPSPDATWGIHLVDVNLALDNLLTFVGGATRSWTAAHRRLGVRVVARRGRRVRIRVTGPPGRRVRVIVRRKGRRVARRSVTLDARGVRILRVRVRPGGRLRVSASR